MQGLGVLPNHAVHCPEDTKLGHWWLLVVTVPQQHLTGNLALRAGGGMGSVLTLGPGLG